MLPTLLLAAAMIAPAVVPATTAARPAAQQGSASLRVVDGFGGAPGGMALSGERLVVGLGTRVRMIDMASPDFDLLAEGAAGRALASLVAPVRNGVVVAGSVGEAGAELRWLELAGSRPESLGAFALRGRPIAIAARDDVAWLSLAGGTTAVVALETDGAGAPGPVLAGGFRLGRDVHALRLDEDIGLALLGAPGSERGQELVVLDVSNPRAPTELARMSLVTSAVDILRVGDVAFLPGVGRGLVVDLSRPDEPRIVAGDPSAGGAPWWPEGLVGLCAAAEGTRVWVGDARPGLIGFDLSEPERPRVIHSDRIAGAAPDCMGLVAGGGMLVRQDSVAQQAYDVRDGLQPEPLGWWEQPTFDAERVAARGHRGWALERAGTRLATLEGGTAMRTRALPPREEGFDVAARGHDEVVVLTRSRIQRFAANADGDAAELPPLDLPVPERSTVYPRHLVGDEGNLFLSGGAQPLWLREDGTLTTLTGVRNARVYAVSGGRAWGHANAAFPALGLWWAPLSGDPVLMEPLTVPAPSTFTTVDQLAAGERRLWAALRSLGVVAWPLTPDGALADQPIGPFDVPGNITGLDIAGPDATILGWYTAGGGSLGSGGVRLMASTASEIYQRAELDLGAPVFDTAVSDGMVWLAAGRAGVLVVEIVDEQAPTPRPTETSSPGTLYLPAVIR